MTAIPYNNDGSRIVKYTKFVYGEYTKYYKCGCHERERKSYTQVSRLGPRIDTIFQDHFSNRVYLNYSLGIVDETTLLRHIYKVCKIAFYPSLFASFASFGVIATRAVQQGLSSPVGKAIYPFIIATPIAIGSWGVGSWAKDKISSIGQQLTANHPVSSNEEALAKFLIKEIFDDNCTASKSDVVKYVRKQWVKFFPHTCNSCAQNGNYLT